MLELSKEERELLVYLLAMYKAQAERGLKYNAAFSRALWVKRAPVLDSIIAKLKQEQL